jgi:hypothetical protein
MWNVPTWLWWGPALVLKIASEVVAGDRGEQIVHRDQVIYFGAL